VDIIPAIPQVAEPFRTPEQAPSWQISNKIPLLAICYVDETARRWRTPRDIAAIARQTELNDAHPTFSDDVRGSIYLLLNQYFIRRGTRSGIVVRHTKLKTFC